MSGPGSGPRAAPPGAGRMLAVATAAFTLCFFAWSLLGPLGPDLQDHLGISDVALSAMVAVPVLLGSVMRVPVGVLTDRLGARPVFTALMAWTLLPLLVLAFWHDGFGVVLALGFLLGFTGATFAVGVPFVSRWHPPERQGFALGVYGMGMGGTVLAGLLAPRIADAWGLRAPFLVAAGLVAAAAAAWLLVARDPPIPRPPAAPVGAALRGLARSARAWALTLFYFLSFGGFVAMFLYLPKLLTGVHGLEASDAGARAAGFALLAVLARPAGGVASDRLGARRVLRWSFAATAALAVVLAAGYASMPALTGASLSIAVAFGLATGAVFKLVADWFPGQVGLVTGVVGAAGGLGGFFPPLLMAAVHVLTGGYALGFVLLGLVAAGCLAVLSATAGASAASPPRSSIRQPAR